MDGAERLDLRTRRGWIWLIVRGFAALVLGIIVGLQQAGPLCGSPLLPQSRPAEIYDSLRRGSKAAAECYRNIDAASIPTWASLPLASSWSWPRSVIRVVSINRSSNGA